MQRVEELLLHLALLKFYFLLLSKQESHLPSNNCIDSHRFIPGPNSKQVSVVVHSFHRQEYFPDLLQITWGEVEVTQHPFKMSISNSIYFP